LIDLNHDPHIDQTLVEKSTLARTMSQHRNEFGFWKRITDAALAMTELIEEDDSKNRTRFIVRDAGCARSEP
jgi:hypothetical protein